MGGEKEKSIIFNVEKSFLSFLVLFFKFYLFIYFGLCWVFAAAFRLSLAAGSRRTSLAAGGSRRASLAAGSRRTSLAAGGAGAPL